MPPSENQTYLQTLMDKEVKDELQRIAKEQKRSMGAFVRDAIQRHLTELGYKDLDVHKGVTEQGENLRNRPRKVK
jgi:hypothetical protein